MLKVKTKFRVIIALYMVIPICIIVFFLKDRPVFLDPSFQGALSISVAACIFLTLCSPVLMGLKWIILKQLKQVSSICKDIKNGKYTYFLLPNEPNGIHEENEMQFLMRNMNWMIRQIESREADLERRVALRTRELESSNVALVKARDEATASARVKAEFLATMSHEIRTPMNAIIGMSDLAMRTDLDQRQKEFLDVIHSASRVLLKIINDILDFSKIDANKLTIECIPVNIRSLFEEIADMFKSELVGKSIEFILAIDPHVPETVLGDPLRLRQVLINLVSNAVKFTCQGEICIQAGADPDAEKTGRLCFSVRDTGIGMDAPTLEKLFTAFSQADGSTTRKFGGTGLGLAISRKLVRLMGGDIHVNSQRGSGSCFSFVLAFDACQIHDEKPGKLPAGLQGKNVLVAVQNDFTRKIILEFLGSFGLNAKGYPALPPESGEAGLDAPKDDFGLAILDLELPNLDLTCLPRWLTPTAPGVSLPIIAIGAFTGKTGLDRLPGADKFLSKPVKQSQLFDAIMDIFGMGSVALDIDPGQFLSGFPLPRILLVEDNVINQKVAMEIFRTAAIVPVVADSGAAALELIQKHPFDAVLMDIQMPGMDGYETLARIKAQGIGRDIPVIAMTANALAADRQKGLAAGMDAYITKPVDAAMLFKTLARCLKKNLPTLPAKPGAESKQARGFIRPDREENPLIKPIPGIDTESALKRIQGNYGLLVEVIIEFARDNKTLFADMSRLILDAQPEKLSALVHRVKGTSQTLSALELSNSLVAVEARISEMGDAFDPEDAGLKSAVEKSEAQFVRILETARSLGSGTGEKTGCNDIGKGNITPEMLAMTDELGRLIRQNSLGAKEFSKQFSEHFQPTGFKAAALCLEAQIKRFDFKQAGQTFDELSAQIRSQASLSPSPIG